MRDFIIQRIKTAHSFIIPVDTQIAEHGDLIPFHVENADCLRIGIDNPGSVKRLLCFLITFIAVIHDVIVFERNRLDTVVSQDAHVTGRNIEKKLVFPFVGRNICGFGQGSLKIDKCHIIPGENITDIGHGEIDIITVILQFAVKIFFFMMIIITADGKVTGACHSQDGGAI